MMNTLTVVQIIVSLLIIGAVLIQNKGTGFGRAFSASPKSFTRRGLEKLVFKGTFFLAGILVLVSIMQLIV